MNYGVHYAVILPFLGFSLVALSLAASLLRDSRASRLFEAGLLLVVIGWIVYVVPFLTLDYRLVEVAENANSDLSFLLRVAASWSGGGGSLYLYATIFSAAILAAVRMIRGSGGAVSGMFLTLSQAIVLALLASAYLNGAFDVVQDSVGGLGLNPLLKSYWVVPHPLTTFGGYAFILAGALVAVYTSDSRLGTGFTLLGWGLLSLGITLGAMWSYETLGWGGYWAWDPVEVSELSVWLLATTALHMAGPLAVLRRPVLLFAGSTALFGPYVTRTGLSPLHSFAAANVGAVLLLLSSISLLLLGVIELSARIHYVRVPRRVRRREDLANTAILVAGLSMLAMAIFVYASLLAPGLLTAFGREATIPTMRQGVDFYHPVLLPLFLASLVFVPGYFLANHIGVRGFIAIVAVELVVSTAMYVATATGRLTILSGAPQPTQLQVAASLPIASISLAALIASLVLELVSGPRRVWALYREVGLRLLHVGMVIAFIGVLISGTYAFNDTFFEAYRITPGTSVDIGLAAITLEDYKYSIYSGSIDLRHHIEASSLTAVGAWLGLAMLDQDLASAIRELDFARREVESNETYQRLTQLLLNEAGYEYNVIHLESNATLAVRDAARGTTVILGQSLPVRIVFENATLRITIVPVTDSSGGLRGAWILPVFEAERTVVEAETLTSTTINPHSIIEANLTTPQHVMLDEDVNLTVYAIRAYPGGNTSIIINGSKIIFRNATIEALNATLHLPPGRLPLPIPAGPGYYLYVQVLRGASGLLETVYEDETVRGILLNETLFRGAIGQSPGVLPTMPEKAPSGLSLDLTIRATIGGEDRIITPSIRFEANGEAQGIHGLVTPAVLLRNGFSDVYMTLHPPMRSGLFGQYHELIVMYAKLALDRLPADQALTLIALMASGYNANTLAQSDQLHAALTVEQTIVDMLLAAEENNTINASGITIMVKYVPGVNLVWLGATIMALTGIALSPGYLIRTPNNGD